MADEIQGLRVVLTGRVQGVGMRATLQMIANDLGVRGWAVNRADGAVELEAAGTNEQLEEFLKKAEKIHPGKITGLERQKIMPNEYRNTFEIRYL